MTIPFDLRAPDAGRTTRTAAIRHANSLVMSAPDLNPVSPTTVPTLGEVLALACAPETTRQREPHSEQHDEWERARREVLAVLKGNLPLASLSGDHVVTVAKSALLRRASDLDVGTWTALVAAHASNPRNTEASHLDEAVERAYHRQRAASPGLGHRVTLVWPRRTLELFRAMVRHVAGRNLRFREFRAFSIPSDSLNDVRALARRLEIDLDPTPFRPTRAADEARALMRELSDPRYWMRDALASLVPVPAAEGLRASEVRLVTDGAEVYCRRRERCAHKHIWHRCEPAVADVLRDLLRGPYAELEAQRGAGGPDYRLVADVRWTGVELQRIRTAADEPDPEADALLDSRARLLLDLGAEGRMGQVRRAMRSDLHVEGSCGQLVLDVPDSERKRASWLLLSPMQQAAVSLSLRVGHLTELERAFRAGTISDFPLFPNGRPQCGRFPANAKAFIDDRTLNDWARNVERRLGIPRVDGEGLYGWRRAFINLFDSWSTSSRVKDLLTGHTDMREPTYGSTRVTVYLDPRDLEHLRAGQRLLEHVRTEFVRSGLPPSDAAPD